MQVMQFRRRTCARRASSRGDSNRIMSLHVEPLEARALLSASSLLDELTAQPFSFSTLAGVTNTTPRGYTPSQIGRAYGFDQISFNGGSVKGDGRGQTIAIVAAYDHPNVFADLQVFDRTFGLPDPPGFKKVNQFGGTSMPAVNAAWAQEIALDVQWAHAIAPAANILLVEANTASLSDLLAAVDTARNTPGVSVVSMSWGTGEFSGQGVYDRYFTTPAGHTPITFIAAAGDSGAQAVWPAISSNVISVGGTSLSTSSSGYSSESAWSGSGGGYSQFVSQPSYQRGVQSSGARSSPDVSMVANPNTGVAIYDSLGISGRSGWFQIGGTSAGAPQWAALVAIVDQGRALSGQPLLGDGHAALYSLVSTDFHDVTVGSNGNRATTGYDLVTGRGTPIANAIVRDLVATSTASTTNPTPTPVAKPTPTPVPTAPQYRYQLVYSNKRWYVVRIVANAVTDDAHDQSINRVAASLAADSTRRPTAAMSEPGRLAVDQDTLPATLASAARLISPSTSPRRAGGKLAPRPADDEGESDSIATDEGNAAEDRAARPAPAPLGAESRVDESDDQPQPEPMDEGASLPQDASRPEIDLRAVATPLESEVVDLCLEPLVALGDQLARQWEADLTVLSVALAVVAYRGRRHASGDPPRVASPRRICRLKRD